MGRKKVPEKTQNEVLIFSKRRCCICYGLENDYTIKQGQIAHLDKDNSNNNFDNLAFLCLNHHDQYDSITSQSKNFTKGEVVTYREKLYFVNKQENNKANPIDGCYIRIDDYNSAQVEIRIIDERKICIVGEAFWGENREFGPNIGTLDIVTDYDHHSKTAYFSDGEYSLTIYFLNNLLKIEEIGVSGCFGMNVYFSGNYKK